MANLSTIYGEYMTFQADAARLKDAIATGRRRRRPRPRVSDLHTHGEHHRGEPPLPQLQNKPRGHPARHRRRQKHARAPHQKIRRERQSQRIHQPPAPRARRAPPPRQSRLHRRLHRRSLRFQQPQHLLPRLPEHLRHDPPRSTSTPSPSRDAFREDQVVSRRSA